MLELLVELDMDWLITWPSGWGVSSKIPRMHIYDILRPKSGFNLDDCVEKFEKAINDIRSAQATLKKSVERVRVLGEKLIQN